MFCNSTCTDKGIDDLDDKNSVHPSHPPGTLGLSGGLSGRGCRRTPIPLRAPLLSTIELTSAFDNMRYIVYTSYFATLALVAALSTEAHGAKRTCMAWLRKSDN